MSRVQPLAGAGAPAPGGVRVATVVGFLVFIELVSGVIQGMMPALLPELGTSLGVGAGKLNWVSSAQLLAAAVCVPLFGRLGDMYGHRRLLRVGMVCLAVGSILVAWSPSFAVLLLGRVLQGPLAALLPLEMGLVRDRLDPEGARSAIGMLVGALTVGASVGLVVAGLLGEVTATVHGVLWVPAAVTVVCVGVVFFLVPESVTRARATVDWAGAGLLTVGLCALLLGIAQGPAWGWAGGGTLGLFALAVVTLVVWVLVELRVSQPIVDIRLSAKRNLLPVYGGSFLLGAALFGSQTAASLFLSSPPEKVGYGFGYDSLAIGWTMLPWGVAAFLASTVAPRLYRVLAPRTVLGLSGVFMAVGYAALVLAHGAVWQFVAANSLTGFGTGLALSAMPALVLDASPAERTGVATGIYNTAKTLGGSVSGAVFAAILSAVTFAGTDVPTESAYTTVWWCCAAVSALVALAAAVLARAPGVSSPATPVPALAGKDLA
ncbi:MULTISPECIES: MFS transporter [unclassified Streptomyces]|uniref:MFS transporter n=1 Tax=unclassified Streptomyces TaxID=2593676 RepID=UPI002DDA85AD|nr:MULTISPECIES: MFS transporter [unclassified Streptomyces]WSA91707.1 MFS transporter [Streptomyces sp. NBC_01795]WSB76080.1 MFS transporter [Streptomyces sp. NBC_01775]WSS44488.1 MFS transporter [Streptomyces sp. NBC_01187]